MAFKKALKVIFITLFLYSCGNNSDKNNPDFSLSTNAKQNHLTLGDTLKIKLNNKKNKQLQSVTYTLNGKSIDEVQVLHNIKLGKHTLIAAIEVDGNSQKLSTDIYINNNSQPKIYTFKIINEFPHDITSYTQGLEFKDNILYESTGQYNESKLRKLDFEKGEILKNLDLEKQYFGEGLTILNNNLYQLTWKSNTGFVYDLDTFKKTRTFTYGQSKEGWGLCNDGEKLYKSDGTEAIYILDPQNLAEVDKIEVYTNNGKIKSLNELEWINGKIYANIYQRNGVVIIDPNNGAVEAVIDFSSLKEKVKQHPGLDVLNGIAYNAKRNTIFVTGKRWDKLFEVEILEE